MPLLARNLTGAPVVLAAGSPAPIIPANATVNVTSELRGLAGADYTALEAQRAGVLEYVWTSSPEFSVGTLTVVLPGSSPRIDRFTGAQTTEVPCPAGFKWARFTIIGGGGGGGGGRRGAAGTIRGGGAGGAGAGKSVIECPVSMLPSVLTVVVGAGGAGGPTTSTDDTNGAVGTAGGNSEIRNGATVLWAATGGGGGLGGTAADMGAGADPGFGWLNYIIPAGYGGGSAVGSPPPALLVDQPTGGGGGGTIQNTNVADAGSQGGSYETFAFLPAGGLGGAVDGALPQPGNPAPEGVIVMGSGTGGGGGASSITQAAQSGASGGCYGAGGGGGGGSLNGFAAGGGGPGKDGAVEIAWF